MPTASRADVFRWQAAHFTLLGSPLYGRPAGQFAEDLRPAGAILGDDASDHGGWLDWLES
jgi:hypothetical protein